MGRYYYRYAHNDWAQFLAEYGIYGCVPLRNAFPLFDGSVDTQNSTELFFFYVFINRAFAYIFT